MEIEIKNIDHFIEGRNIGTMFIDIDGVLLKSCDCICNLLRSQEGLYTNVTGKVIFTWNFKEAFDEDANMRGDETSLSDEYMSFVIEKLFESEEFFNRVKFIDGAIDFLKKYKDKTICVTKSNIKNLYGKIRLLESENLGDIPIIGMPLDISKGFINMQYGKGNSLFIDDCAVNLIESNADYKIQFREYNDGQNDKRKWISDWTANGRNEYVMYHW
jgi:hypothetical protein